jgi:diguanylate cyclase (GGDEF)-like protein
LAIVLAVVLAGGAWWAHSSSRAHASNDEVREVAASGRLVEARLTFERSALELLLDRLLVGIGEREPDSAVATDAADQLRLAHDEIEELATGDGAVAQVAADLADALAGGMEDDPLSGDRLDLYDAVDDVRWSVESVRGADQFDALFELGFFSSLPSHVLVEALAAYADVGQYPMDPVATALFDEVIEVVRSDGGWFGESSDAPLTDSEWFDVEGARSAFPEATAALETLFASSPVIAVDTWMRELADSSTPAPIPLVDVLDVIADLRVEATALIAPLVTTEIEAANARVEADAADRSTWGLVAMVAAALALVLLAIGLVRMVGHRRSLRRLSDLALNDPVTGVSSRYVLETSVRAALADTRYGHHVVVIIDLDHFKMVNDAFGHAAGDAVLKEVGTRLRSIAESIALGSTPPGRSHVVRMGGDEFLVAIHGTTDVPIDRLTADLDSARNVAFDVSVEGRLESLAPEFSFGVSDARGSCDLDDLMAAADLASYADKTKRSIGRRASDRESQLPPASGHVTQP